MSKEAIIRVELRWRQAKQNPHQHRMPRLDELRRSETHTHYTLPVYEDLSVRFSDGTDKVLQYRITARYIEGGATEWQDVPVEEQEDTKGK